MKRLIIASENEEYQTGGKTFEGYMGAVGWEGKNYDIARDVKDIAKIVRTQFKKKFPGYKLSVRISRFSGGESIDAMLWMHKSDLMDKETYLSQVVPNPWKFVKGYWIGAPRADGTWEDIRSEKLGEMSNEERYDFFSRYYDYCLENYGTGKPYSRINYGWEPIPLLTDEPLKYVKNLLDSFNRDDSNSMVDYFSVNFYSSIYYAYD